VAGHAQARIQRCRGCRDRAPCRRLAGDDRHSFAHLAARAELVRAKVKAVELEAERLQQEAMYELADATPWGQDAPSLADAARGNIAAYEAMGGKAFPKPAIETLLAALPASGRTTEE
jgi:hypothetical protein